MKYLQLFFCVAVIANLESNLSYWKSLGERADTATPPVQVSVSPVKEEQHDVEELANTDAASESDTDVNE